MGNDQFLSLMQAVDFASVTLDVLACAALLASLFVTIRGCVLFLGFLLRDGAVQLSDDGFSADDFDRCCGGSVEGVGLDNEPDHWDPVDQRDTCADEMDGNDLYDY